jgi:hypothetical protein
LTPKLTNPCVVSTMLIPELDLLMAYKRFPAAVKMYTIVNKLHRQQIAM